MALGRDAHAPLRAGRALSDGHGVPRVEVRRGTRAESGASLESSVSWSFSTPPPRVVAIHPEGGPEPLDTLLFAAFDQAIDRAAVLATVRVRAQDRDVPLRPATPKEVDADREVSGLAAQAEDGRWLAFRTQKALPPDSAVTVTVGPGVPSAEGPRVTEEPQTSSFRTHGPFRVEKHECGWGGRGCSPQDPWRIELTNPVDARAFREEMVRVDPPVPGLKAAVGGSTVLLQGSKKGRTSYRVSQSPEIRDAFGQTLEAGPALSFDVGPADTALFAPGGEFVVLDPGGAGRFAVYSVNHPGLRMRARAVGPGDWAAWHAYRQRIWQDAKAQPPGRRVLDTTVQTEGEEDELVETRLDLSPALEGGLGQIVLVVEPLKPKKNDRHQAARTWVQATHIGLDAFADGHRLLAWATALADGSPLEDIEVSLEPGKTVRTDSTGLARLALAETPAPGGDEVTPYGAPGLGGPSSPGRWWWWSRPWFEHQNLRDERVEAFSSLLWEGVHTYRYVARATTVGTFVVPPPKAEEMYAPETFGRGGTDIVIVE